MGFYSKTDDRTGGGEDGDDGRGDAAHETGWRKSALKTYTLESEIVLPRGIEEVFAFFSDAMNLEAITPPWVQFSVLTPAPIEMRVGLRIDYKLKIHRFPVRWQSEITAWEPPHRFIDEQRRGPYQLWIHEHRFESCPEGTRMTDHVRYAALGGSLVQKYLVAPDLRRIWAYREAQMRKRFGPERREPAVV